jgi:hypothetical protein
MNRTGRARVPLNFRYVRRPGWDSIAGNSDNGLDDPTLGRFEVLVCMELLTVVAK